MHPRLTELTTYLDAQRADLAAAVAAVDPSRRTESPAPGRWSVAQVLEHLVLLERRFVDYFGAWLAEAKAAGAKEEDASPVMPTINIARVLNRSRKVTAPPQGEPSGQMTVEDAIAGLDEARRALKAKLAEVDGLALGRITKPHPVLGPITLYEWIAFVGSHMGRHAAQVREIGDELR